MLTPRYATPILALVLLTQTSCIGMSDEPTASKSTSPVALELGQPWRLESLAGERIQTEPPVTLQFSNEGRVSGHGGCNRYFGIFKAEPDGTLNIGQVGATKMFCPDSADLEQRYFAALSHVAGFSFDADRLHLSGENGELVFSKQ